ncbi:MAG: potassium channel family protein [Actinomycetota bacterium]
MSQQHNQPRIPMMLRVNNWELLIVSGLLILIFITRQSGNLPGALIRSIDLAISIAVLGFALHSGRARRGAIRVHVGIAASAVVLSLIGLITDIDAIQRSAGAVTAYLIAASTFLILRVVMRQRRVTGDTLFGVVAAYLAIGVLFAMIYTIIARWSPDSFEPPQPVIDGQTDLFYFSFITLAGLGYGDIAPASDLVRVLAPLEAILGIILLAGLVGRIVGLQVAQTTERNSQEHVDTITRAIENLDTDRNASDK